MSPVAALLVLAGCSSPPPAPVEPAPRVLPKIDGHLHVQTPVNAQIVLMTMAAQGIEATVLVGSVPATFGLPYDDPWQDYRALNETLLTAAAINPERLLPFPIVRGDESDASALIADYKARGARGLKMFSGHHLFNVGDMGAEAYDPIFEAAVANDLPIINHVSLNYFPDEARGMLDRHPDLVTIIPHLGFKKSDPMVLAEWLDAYPNLYFDMSMGGPLPESLVAGSANVEAYRTFMTTYAHRLIWGSDLIVSESNGMTRKRMMKMQDCYIAFYENPETFTCDLVSSYLEAQGKDPNQTLYALGLDDKTLNQIYTGTARSVFKGLPPAK